MLRDVGAALAGLVTAFALIALIEWIGHAIYPPPADLDFSDPVAMPTYVAQLPIPALLFPMFAWFIGAFCGTLVAAGIGLARPIVFAFTVGLLVLTGTIANLILIPHPMWFSALAVIGIVLSTWLAMLVAESFRGDQAD